MREAGATAAQEAGFTIANGIAYVQAMLDKGMEVDSFAPRFSFFFAAYTNILEEVAKFRALRRIWARIMKEQGKKEKAKQTKIKREKEKEQKKKEEKEVKEKETEE